MHRQYGFPVLAIQEVTLFALIFIRLVSFLLNLLTVTAKCVLFYTYFQTVKASF